MKGSITIQMPSMRTTTCLFFLTLTTCPLYPANGPLVICTYWFSLKSVLLYISHLVVSSAVNSLRRSMELSDITCICLLLGYRYIQNGMESSGCSRPCCSKLMAFCLVVFMNRTWGIIALSLLFLPGNLTVSFGNRISSQRGASCSSALKSYRVFMANHSADSFCFVHCSFINTFLSFLYGANNGCHTSITTVRMLLISDLKDEPIQVLSKWLQPKLSSSKYR